MATTTKKGSKNTKAKPRRAAVKSPPAKQAQTIADLRQELEARDHELAESLQRENGLGASDGNRRGARHHQSLTDRRATGA